MTQSSTEIASRTWEAWCPSTSSWATWAKPLLFAVGAPLASLAAESAPTAPVHLPFIDAGERDSFVIVDAPGATGIAIGLALAAVGFRPVPLYNGVPGEFSLIDVTELQRGLVAGTPTLESLALSMDAPPAFLLDARRMSGTPAERTFDNRWVVIPEDFPSATRLLSLGLRRCILVRPPAHEDLSHVLARYRDAGIRVEHVQNDVLVPFDVRTPSKLVSLFRRFAVQVGLKRSSAGGFGGFIPEAASSHG